MESNGIEITREHPRNRWADEVLKDIRVLSVENWTKVAMGRSSGEAETHRGLLEKRRRRKKV